MKFVDFENREAWLKWRRGGIGSSDAIMLAAAQAMITPPSWMEETALQSLFWEKLGMGREKAENEPMRRGKEMEEPVRCLVEARLGFLSPLNVEREDYPWLRASLDGLTLQDEIVEIKVPNEHVIQLAKAGQVVDYYQPQLAHQLMALHGHPAGWRGTERVHFVAYDFLEEQAHIVSLNSEALRELAIKLFEAEKAFWHKVQKGQPLVGGYAWYGLAMTLSDAKTDVQLADEYKDMVKEAVQKKVYTPTNFYVRDVKAKKVRRVDWEAVVTEVGAPQELLDKHKTETLWVVMGGARPVAATPCEPAMAETRHLVHRRSKEECELLMERTKAMAAEVGELVGPFGMRVYERKGVIAFAQVAKELIIDPAIIASHTESNDVDGYISLVTKGEKAASKSGAKSMMTDACEVAAVA